MENLQAVIDAVHAGMTPEVIAESTTRRTFFIPGHGVHPSRVETIDLEHGAAVPARKRGSVAVFDVASFNMLLRDNADAGAVSIYVDRSPHKPGVVAVLNGNGPAGPGWGDFRVRIEFRPTAQWIKWVGIDGKMLPQVAFAEFIEDNLEDIADPSGAQMLEIAQHLEVARSVNFRSGVRLSSGVVQFRHEQSEDTKVAGGTIEVPEVITLGIAPIMSMPSYRIPARFRYRLADGRLTLGIKLQRVETLMTSIVNDVVEKIEKGSNISVLDGAPPHALTSLQA